MIRVLIRSTGAAAVTAFLLWQSVLRRRRRIVEWAVLGIAALLVVQIGLVFVRDMRNLRDWDYPIFYTVGRTAHAGEDFYDPDVLEKTLRANDTDIPDRWLTESPGWWYPPPTALYLAPLAIPQYRTSLAIHFGIQLLMIAGTIAALRRFPPWNQTVIGSVSILSLLALFEPTRSSLSLGQISFLALFFIALSMTLIEKRQGMAGLALGVAAVFKPIALAMALLLPFMRRGRAALAAGATFLATVALSTATFGLQSLTSFGQFGPGDRPAELSLDPVIQSLLGVLRRLFSESPSGDGALEAILYWPYIVGAGILTTVAVWILIRYSNSRSRPLCLALVIATALLVYPNTLQNTIVLIFPAIICLWSETHSASDLRVRSLVLIVVAVGLAGARGEYTGFLAMLTVWLGLVISLPRVVAPSASASSVGSGAA